MGSLTSKGCFQINIDKISKCIDFLTHINHILKVSFIFKKFNWVKCTFMIIKERKLMTYCEVTYLYRFILICFFWCRYILYHFDTFGFRFSLRPSVGVYLLCNGGPFIIIPSIYSKVVFHILVLCYFTV